MVPGCLTLSGSFENPKNLYRTFLDGPSFQRKINSASSLMFSYILGSQEWKIEWIIDLRERERERGPLNILYWIL